MYWNTLKFLRSKQISYRILYALKTRLKAKPKLLPSPRKAAPIDWIPFPRKADSLALNGEFTFLNIGKKFGSNVNWNYSDFGKLWTYNLCYFDFLNQSESHSSSASLMENFATNYGSVRDGLESYPTSLRIINWVKYLSQHPQDEISLQNVTYTDLHRLSHRLEYHLMGNHLLENGFALLIGGIFFNETRFIDIGQKIVENELEEQILDDGGHFELSPMYHQIILERLLDTINCVREYDVVSEDFKTLLRDKAGLMIGWLDQISFRSGDIPRVSDSVEGVALGKEVLLDYADRLGIAKKTTALKGSGYRKMCTDNVELLIDVGPLGPDYIPGHAHDDILNFLIYGDGQPLLVDPGISSYECDSHRNFERSKSAHNSVYVHSMESSEMWGAFRVARRESCQVVEEKENYLEARCFGIDGMKKSFTRSFKLTDNGLVITDHLANDGTGTASFHFHPSVTYTVEDFSLTGDFGSISFEGAKSLKDLEYNYAEGFNRRVPARVIEVEFESKLESNFLFR